MEPIASFSGLATGVDFQELVTQIIEIESNRLDYLRVSISEDQAERAAWEEVRGLLQTLESAVGDLESGRALDSFAATLLGANTSILTATADSFASPGRHSVRVLQQAQREVLGSGTYASRSDALGITGQFVVQGSVIDVDAADSLQDIAGRINALNFGPDALGVSASVVGSTGSYRLVLAASETGSDGVDLLDLTGALGTLGFFDGTTEIKNRTSGGFESDGFDDSTSTVASLLGFAGSAPSGTVTLGSGAGAFNVTLDLNSMSLADVRDAINTAAAGAGSSMFASVETVVQDGVAQYHLSISGTPAATDAGAVLQALGLLQGGTSAVSQVVQGDVLTTDAGGTPATAATLLTALFNNGVGAGVTVGDTIDFSGTDHDGNAFSFTHTIGASDTLQTLLTRLEGAEGFNGGATATVDASGRLTITSNTAGSSQLSLSALAGNEGGGILDLGAFSVTDAGRDRLITAGADALVEIDGALVTSASNDITGAIPGVTLNVLGADPANPIEVVIEQDTTVAVEAVQVFVDAFNAFAEFVNAGSGVIGEERPPLAGDQLLRGIRDRLSFALLAGVPASAAGSYSRLSEIGVEVTRDGTYTLDSALLETALRTDPASVERIFGDYGVASTSALTYIGAGSSTQPGTYAVSVSQLPTFAFLDSVGFGGTYVDDGTPDTLSLTDVSSGAQYDVSLSNGMSLVQIIAAINAELSVTRQHELTSSRTMYSDSGASTLANGSTLLQDLYHGAGQSSGFLAGQTVTFSGTKPDGSAVLETFDVTDPSTQTLGQLRAAAQSAFGSNVIVSIQNGQLVAEDQNSGTSQLTMTVSADIPGNANPFGTMDVTEIGRGAGGLVAEANGTELRIRDPQYGSSEGFTVSFTPGGGDGTASLGLATGTYTGQDVIGTIGGEAATGNGNLLVADTGTTADGLTVRVGGSTTGSIGEVTYGTGLLTSVEGILDELLAPGDGGVDGIVKRLTESEDRLETRLGDREARLEVRRQNLLLRFSRLEQLIAQFQTVQASLTSQLTALSSGS